MALADRDFRQDQGLVFPLFLAHPADEEIPSPQDGFGIFLHAPVGAQFIAPLAQGVGKEALLVQPVFPGQFQGHFPEQFQSPGHLDGLEHDEGDPGDEILAQQLFGLISVAHDSGFLPSVYRIQLQEMLQLSAAVLGSRGFQAELDPVRPFLDFRRKLLPQGFRQTGQGHRFLQPGSVPVPGSPILR